MQCSSCLHKVHGSVIFHVNIHVYPCIHEKVIDLVRLQEIKGGLTAFLAGNLIFPYLYVPVVTPLDSVLSDITWVSVWLSGSFLISGRWSG